MHANRTGGGSLMDKALDFVAWSVLAIFILAGVGTLVAFYCSIAIYGSPEHRLALALMTIFAALIGWATYRTSRHERSK